MTRFIDICSYAIFLGIDWTLSGLILWWSYDIKAQISGGFYSYDQAILLIRNMGLVVTMLTGIAWFLTKKFRGRGQDRWAVWSVIWTTALLGSVYIFVVAGRQLWKLDQGLGDSSVFLPFVGHVNAQLFSERWLSFHSLVVPAMGVISGILYYLQGRLSTLYERHAFGRLHRQRKRH